MTQLSVQNKPRRPVLVVSREQLNHILPVVNVLPLTSSKNPSRTAYANEVYLPAIATGLALDSIVLCYQIRTFDKRRLERQIAMLQDTTLRTAILEAVRFQLDM